MAIRFSGKAPPPHRLRQQGHHPHAGPTQPHHFSAPVLPYLFSNLCSRRSRGYRLTLFPRLSGPHSCNNPSSQASTLIRSLEDPLRRDLWRYNRLEDSRPGPLTFFRIPPPLQPRCLPRCRRYLTRMTLIQLGHS
ncbi:hypothetical protein DTO013E5_902 [Penicillium roqueforti]|uniref:uncharacterized protein n=1 Tax=Penicillium roqueforti TaxID=5082 RepID=UPI00190B01E4|nr:uncharacterized protein LCP9604111_2072 [Penicillium roqueforti]KAF9252076.1 hypothetical protein LCP9604111_2072 [Penicillium roqueforti]KAI1837345.1 hypothetical protein CBS147337_1628 [Penicillium roqueforti]KAI2687783.1 hypothetical protein LCP963914a_3301 [Penicillium roqueforti]KAI2689849.1 hypothetical protein CBS147355_300 [Penicillium roqueforti]KAI2702386.1 hypothetical protein CBS147372_4119 [Penicillium roqueforti]